MTVVIEHRAASVLGHNDDRSRRIPLSNREDLLLRSNCHPKRGIPADARMRRMFQCKVADSELKVFQWSLAADCDSRNGLTRKYRD
jgi:hypothetical protein